MEKPPIYSLIIPIGIDRANFDNRIGNICTLLDDDIAGCYEIVAIESPKQNGASEDWDKVHGEVIVVIDGDLDRTPTTLREVIGSFEKGSDMAFAGQYAPDATFDDEPELSYFGIRRTSLGNIDKSPEGQQLVLEILGPEVIRKLMEPTPTSGHVYILTHLRKLIGIR